MAQTDQSNNAVTAYLAVVQFFFVLTWTVYVAYLPDLLAQAGIGKGKAGWVLLADMVLFALFDVAAGFAAERAFKLYARLGPVLLALTLLSALAFIGLPWLASANTAPLLLSLIVVWAVTSSALRTPVFALLARHLPPAQLPGAAGKVLAGMALAGAVSPYLGTVLKGMDPRLPFALSSLTLLAVAGGLIAAERRLQQLEPAPSAASISPPLPAWLFFPLLLLAALSFQVVFHLDAAPRYLQDSTAANLVWLMPVFWIGFNIAVYAGGPLSRRSGVLPVFAFGCLLGTIGAAIGAGVSGLEAAASGQFIAGLGWGTVIAAAFGLASACGQPGRVATAIGLLFAMLALAGFVRIGINLAGWPKQPAMAEWLLWLPVVGWLVVALVSTLAGRSRTQQDARTE